MANAFVVSGLTDYVENKRDTLIKSAVIGRTPNYTLDKVSKRFGIKTSERLNYADIRPVLADGRGCSFNPQGSVELSDRLLETAIYKVDMELCPDALLGKYLENQVAIAAGKERLPLEEEITNEIVDGYADAVERLAWVGATSANSGTDLVDGYVTLAKNQDSGSTIFCTAATSADSVYGAIKKVYMEIPEEILDDAFIAVGPDLFRQYIQELVAANLYHYDPANGAINEMFLPGTDIKVVKVKGLANTKYIYASTWKNLVAGMDMLDDKEQFDLWFSRDNQTYRIHLRANFGFMTYFPDEVVLADIAGE